MDIPVDIATRELQWVTNEPYVDDNSVYQSLDEEIDARARCTQKLHARATPREVESSIPSGWIRTNTFSGGDNQHLAGPLYFGSD